MRSVEGIILASMQLRDASFWQLLSSLSFLQVLFSMEALLIQGFLCSFLEEFLKEVANSFSAPFVSLVSLFQLKFEISLLIGYSLSLLNQAQELSQTTNLKNFHFKIHEAYRLEC